MSILITGAEGFLGTHLAKLLHDSGEQVVGLDVIESPTPRPWPVVVGDVTDRAFIERLFDEHGVTSVVHAGGVSGPHVCNNFPAKVFEVNVLGTLNLFEVARLRKLPGRIVFLSSSSVYGQAAEKASCETPVVEGLPLLASEPYGATKVSCEAMLRAFNAQEEIDAVSLRISIVYGAGRTAYCGISEMIKAALADEPILLDAGCDVPLPWVYVDDVCLALQRALTVRRASIGERDTLAYNVTGPGFPTFREIAELVKSHIPAAKIEQTSDPDKYAMNARKMSLAAIERDLGWKPQVDIRQGVKLLVESFTSQEARKPLAAAR
jgi:UDP-glucose 4-epimerase